MTVTNHTALYRVTIPANSSTLRQNALPYSPLILFDLTDLPESRINGSITVDGNTGRITGNGTFSPSFGLGTYDLHFCADFLGADIRDTVRNSRSTGFPILCGFVCSKSEMSLNFGAKRNISEPRGARSILIFQLF
jgi:hypothetical protein